MNVHQDQGRFRASRSTPVEAPAPTRLRWRERDFDLRGMNDPRWLLIWNETQDRRIRHRDQQTNVRCAESRANRLHACKAIKEAAR